ncbi:TRAP transporter small permease [Chelativorans salis]|uniref:TRAP transporter small permease protein n=1 Tax=Chelativorans salis TaxID=2978478 RepID=A0ABT2LV31_9HYPH|nr:TRAP transporter small permease [Chelativorans sp. EGI FJ00035]MCT7378369.1 TRAP transporter small permease [Chelativorans sp. EGI FJ00035]
MRARILTLLRHLTNALALVAAAGVLAMLLHVTADIVGRQIFGRPVPATVEIVSRYYMLLIAFLPLAWTERRGEMIAVDVFAGLFRGRWERVDKVLVNVLSFAAFAFLTYTTWFAAMREFGSGSFVLSLSVAVPVWPGYFVLPLAFALASLVSALKLYLCLTGTEDSAEGAAFSEQGEGSTSP